MKVDSKSALETSGQLALASALTFEGWVPVELGTLGVARSGIERPRLRERVEALEGKR